MPIRTRRVPQTTLVLDLDETLIHCSPAPNPKVPYHFTIDLAFEDGNFKAFVYKRPFMDYFLSEVTRKYEVVIFTASEKAYAKPILDTIDPQGKIRHRIYRDSC